MTKQYKSMTQQYIIYIILGILFIINCVFIYYLVKNNSTISKLQKKVDKIEAEADKRGTGVRPSVIIKTPTPQTQTPTTTAQPGPDIYDFIMKNVFPVKGVYEQHGDIIFNTVVGQSKYDSSTNTMTLPLINDQTGGYGYFSTKTNKIFLDIRLFTPLGLGKSAYSSLNKLNIGNLSFNIRYNDFYDLSSPDSGTTIGWIVYDIIDFSVIEEQPSQVLKAKDISDFIIANIALVDNQKAIEVNGQDIKFHIDKNSDDNIYKKESNTLKIRLFEDIDGICYFSYSKNKLFIDTGLFEHIGLSESVYSSLDKIILGNLFFNTIYRADYSTNPGTIAYDITEGHSVDEQPDMPKPNPDFDQPDIPNPAVDCNVCATTFKNNGGCTASTDEERNSKIPPGCSSCAAETQALCSQTDEWV